MSNTLPNSPQSSVFRAQGVTPTEQYLQSLCDRSFLSLWSYPCIYRDQKQGGKGHGKELCDLLVVFGNDVLIFSDKNCAFPQTGNLGVDWCRWFKKAIMESANQVWGAERCLRKSPTRLFLDRACTKPFPLEIPSSETMRIHNIVVVHNVADRCAEYFGGGSSGTLVFNSDLVGAAHYSDPNACEPFNVGWLSPDQSFVHVLDDACLDILLKERDTITDFVKYLRAKEELLGSRRKSGRRISYPGEEELLAHYLVTIQNNRHIFSFPADVHSIAIGEGDWALFETSPQRKAQKVADEISYSWDDLIETFNQNILRGTSYASSSPTIQDREKTIRFLAREPRFRRRILAGALLEIIKNTQPSYRATRIVQPSSPGDPYYCFMLLPRHPGDAETYREIRWMLLEALCCVTKLMFPDALDIVGLATETGFETTPRSEDALYLDARIWDEESQTEARRMQQEFGLLINTTRFENKVLEFPTTRAKA